MKDVKHVKLEFPDDLYAVVKEAAWLARTPIRRWCAEIVARVAAEKTGMPLPPSNPTQSENTATAK